MRVRAKTATASHRSKSMRSNGLRRRGCQNRGDVSSQFLSALLMAAPLLKARDDRPGSLTGRWFLSRYVAMTDRMMEELWGYRHEPGRSATPTSEAPVNVGANSEYQIEPDASAASYFFAAAAISQGGTVTVLGLAAAQRDLAGRHRVR